MKTVALQAQNLQYVCAEGGGGREVVANRCLSIAENAAQHDDCWALTKAVEGDPAAVCGGHVSAPLSSLLLSDS